MPFYLNKTVKKERYHFRTNSCLEKYLCLIFKVLKEEIILIKKQLHNGQEVKRSEVQYEGQSSNQEGKNMTLHH